MADLHINMTNVDEGMEVVMVHDVGRNDGNWNAHVSIIRGLHGVAQIEVFDVTHHAAAAGHGYNTVKEQFGSDEVSSFGADIARVFNVVATNGPPDAMGDGLFWAMSTDDAQVRGTATVRKGRNRNEKHSVGPGDVSCALCQAVYLSGIGLLPQCTIRTFAEFSIFSELTSVGAEGIAMASGVGRAGQRGCRCGCMESMETGRPVTMAFGSGCWVASDGRRWTQGKFSAIAGGNGGIIREWVN